MTEIRSSSWDWAKPVSGSSIPNLADQRYWHRTWTYGTSQRVTSTAMGHIDMFVVATGTDCKIGDVGDYGGPNPQTARPVA